MNGGACLIYLSVLVLMILLSVFLSRRSREGGKNIFYYTVVLGAIGGVIGIILIETLGTPEYAPIGVYFFVISAGIIVTTFGTWLISGFPPQ